MAVTRRQVLRTLGAACAGGLAPGAADATSHEPPAAEAFGVLVDTTACIGCRKCEWACNQANQLPVQPIETFEDTSVFATHRRPDATFEAGHFHSNPIQVAVAATPR